MRWLEEVEVKHVEFLRTIKHFDASYRAWDSIAKQESRPGFATFARKQCSTYAALRDDALRLFKAAGDVRFVGVRDARELLGAIYEFRRDELGWLGSHISELESTR